MNGDNELLKDTMVLGCLVVPFMWKLFKNYQKFELHKQNVLQTNAPSSVLQPDELNILLPKKYLQNQSLNKNKLLENPMELKDQLLPLIKQLRMTNQIEYEIDGEYIKIWAPLKGRLYSPEKIESLDPLQNVFL
jgi:hypothetical protein